MKHVRQRQQLIFTQPSRTKQAFKDECDVNNILKKYNKTQQLTHINQIQGSYGDFSNASDYHQALNSVMDANDRFYGLPSSIRQEFNNSPAQFLDFIHNDENYDKAAKMGLLDPEKTKIYLDSLPTTPTDAPE